VVDWKRVEAVSSLPRFDRGETSLGSLDGAQWLMNQGRAVFSQLISFLPDRELRRCGERHQGTAGCADLPAGIRIVPRLSRQY
jgi:hypothetical protein